jgi:hypothetical protein
METLLMTTWSDGEGEIVRQLLDECGIPCRMASDVPHTVLPLAVDGLGEVRIFVPDDRIDEAREILAEHRRQGISAVPDDDVSER